MIILLAPSKTLNFTNIHLTERVPQFMTQARFLADRIKRLKIQDIQQICKVSASLAAENYHRYQNIFHPGNPKNAALYAYAGDVYDGLEADTFSHKELEWCDKHLVILSGLYGALHPLDQIEPYRLEMKTSLPFLKSSLSEYWREHVTQALIDSQSPNETCIINLASSEYTHCIERAKFDKWIDVAFLQQKGKTLKNIALFTKRARGMLARFIIQHSITNPADLVHFAHDGYRIHTTPSKPYELVFVRKY